MLARSSLYRIHLLCRSLNQTATQCKHSIHVSLNNTNHIIDTTADNNSSPFSKLGITSQPLLNAIHQHYTEPSDIQKLAVPSIINNSLHNHIIGDITGQGKTNVYIWSLIQLLSQHPLQYNTKYKHSPTIYIVQPSIELCIQCNNMIQQLRLGDVRAHLLYNAVPYPSYRTSQIPWTSSTINICICTPIVLDALIDNNTEYQSQIHSNNIVPLLANTRYIVYDECDLLVSGHFMKHTKSIVKSVRRYNTHHTATQPITSILVGASLVHTGHTTSPMKYIYNNFSNSIYCTTNKLHSINQNVQQHWIQVSSTNQRVNTVYDILNKLYSTNNNQTIINILIFCNTSLSVKQCYESLQNFDVIQNNNNNLELYMYHTGLSKHERVESLYKYNQSTNKNKILISTNILSRGIDLPYMKCMIQYDMCENTTDYIHRVGRVNRLHSIQYSDSNQTDNNHNYSLVYNLYDDSNQLIVNSIVNNNELTLDHTFSIKRSARKQYRKQQKSVQ